MEESSCHGVRDPPPTWIFLSSEKVSQRTLAGVNGVGKKDGQGRVTRVQEMGETVETVLGLRDGEVVHSYFHTDVQELEYKDLLTSTFTKTDHDMKNGLSKDCYP
jgi:hypothetical protein